MSKLLSIVIPAYNCAKYIAECLDSILESNSHDFEVVVIDDGSTDETLEILSSIKDTRLRYFHQDNVGVSISRNKGIDLASGRYIMFVDADDVLVRGWSSIIDDRLKEIADVSIFLKDSISKHYDKETILRSVTSVGGEVELRWITSPFSKLYNTEFIKEYGIQFNDAIINGEDALFNLEVILFADVIVFDNRSFYKYRIHPSSTTNTFNSAFLESNEVYLNRVKELLEKSSLSQDEIQEIIDTSFCRSVMILVSKIARIDNRIARNDALSESKNSECLNFRIESTSSSFEANSIVERITYWLVAHSRLKLAVMITRQILMLKGFHSRFDWVSV